MKPGSLAHALGSAMGARVGMAVLNYGLFWLLSHRLGTTTLGGFSLLMNVFYMSAMLPLLGLSGPLTRRAATERVREAARFHELPHAVSATMSSCARRCRHSACSVPAVSQIMKMRMSA